MLWVYSRMSRVGFMCLEAVQAARCNNLVMKTQRKTQIGKLHIASLESIRMQVSIRILGRGFFCTRDVDPIPMNTDSQSRSSPRGQNLVSSQRQPMGHLIFSDMKPRYVIGGVGYHQESV